MQLCIGRPTLFSNVPKRLCSLMALSLLAVVMPRPAQAQRAVGIDVSDYQSASINWSTLKNTYGIVFGWAKISEGTSSGSGVGGGNFTTYAANAKTAGVLIGAYHYARYDLHPGTSGATSEANVFWGAAQNYINASGYYIMPMLDVEASFSGQTKATLSAWVNQWCYTVSNSAAAAGVLGVRPCIYCSSSHASTYLDSTVTQWITDIADWPYAHSTALSQAQAASAPPAGITPWTSWQFWQYDDQNAAQAYTTGDGDIFNGTLAQLRTTMVIGAGNPVITNQPVSLVRTQGNTATFTVVAGPPGLNYQWRKNGTAVSSATTSILTLNSIKTNDAASYTVVVNNTTAALTSSVATLTVLAPPGILAQPQSLAVPQGWCTNFNISAAGTAPLYYQWQWNSTPFAPSTAGTSWTACNTGSYFCIVSNSVGTATSSVVTLSYMTPPVIINSPQSAVIQSGSCTNLSVGASGSPALYYQWRWNNTTFSPSSGAANWTACNEGAYSCIVSNLAGSVTSDVAVVSFLAPPSITVQPQSQTNVAGWGTLLSVGATGTPPLTYQWFWNGTAFAPSTSSTLTAADAGSYWVTVSNLTGVVTQSQTAYLVLTNALPGQFDSVIRLGDGTVQLNMSGTPGTNYTLLGSSDWSNWPSLETLSSGTGTFQYTDTSTTNLNQRFYRLRLGE